jgi:hypothetical protein
MIGRLIVGLLGTVVVAGAALVLGYRGYDAFLRWLVAGQGPAAGEAPAGAGTSAPAITSASEGSAP